MKNEIKVGDCFKRKSDGDLFIVTGFDEKTITTMFVGRKIDTSNYYNSRSTTNFFENYCEPITRAEFDAALDARFAAIKAELPEVK